MRRDTEILRLTAYAGPGGTTSGRPCANDLRLACRIPLLNINCSVLNRPRRASSRRYDGAGALLRHGCVISQLGYWIACVACRKMAPILLHKEGRGDSVLP